MSVPFKLLFDKAEIADYIKQDPHGERNKRKGQAAVLNAETVEVYDRRYII